MEIKLKTMQIFSQCRINNFLSIKCFLKVLKTFPRHFKILYDVQTACSEKAALLQPSALLCFMQAEV